MRQKRSARKFISVAISLAMVLAMAFNVSTLAWAEDDVDDNNNQSKATSTTGDVADDLEKDIQGGSSDENTESNEDDAVTENDNEKDAQRDEKQGKKTSKKVKAQAASAFTVNGTDYDTLEEAVNATNAGDTIIMNADSEVDSAIRISNNLTLKMNGHTLTSKLSSGSMITIVSGKTVTIEGGTITSVKDGARAINVAGTLNVKDTTFEDFYATSKDGGGAIQFSNSATGEVDNCKFNNNKAQYNGGAILVRTCKDVSINDSSFTNNVGAEEVWGVLLYDGGGAICVRPDNLDNRTIITGCTFTGNETKYCGGAIDAGQYARVIVEGSTFKSNSCGIQGGAIVGACAEELIVVDCVIDGNSAKCGFPEYSDSFYRNRLRSGYGGGISIFYAAEDDSGVALFDNNIIRNNTADLRGGGISTSKPRSTGSAVDITGNTIIEGNSATIGGGIDYTAHNQMPLVLNNALITGNNAVRGGGIWLCPDGSLDLSSALGGTIIDNKTSGSMRGLVHGGTVYANGDDICHEGSDSDDYPREVGYTGGVAIDTRGPGGVKIDWHTDEADARNAGLVKDAISNGYPDILSDEGTDKSFGIHGEIAGVDAADKARLLKESEKGAQIIIRNNTATTRGGGIAANSPITMGVEEDDVYRLNAIRTMNVEKKWKGKEVTESVKVNLVRYDADQDGNALKGNNGAYVNKTVLDRNVLISEDDDWKTEFIDLPSEYTDENGVKHYCNYTIEELASKEYTGEITSREESGSVIELVLTNTPKSDDKDKKKNSKKYSPKGKQGSVKKVDKGNAKTGDNIIMVNIFITLAILSLITMLLLRRKTNNR